MTDRIPAARLQQDLELVGGRVRARRGSSARAGACGPAAPALAEDQVPGPWPMPAWPLRRPLQHEERLQRQIVETLRPELAARQAVIASVGGEVRMGGRLGLALQALRKAMGGVPGLPDLIVFFPRALPLFLECKRPSERRIQPVDGQLRIRTVGAGQLSGDQLTFRDWAVRAGMPWALVRSVDEARAAVAAHWPEG